MELYINNAKEGDRLIGFFIIKDIQKKMANNGSLYFDLLLEDQSGTISAKLWDITDQQEEMFEAKKIVKIDGLVTLYRSQKQLQIQRIRLTTPEDGVEIEDVVQSVKIPREELWQELRMFIQEIESPLMSKIVKTILGTKAIRDRLTTIPAAKKMHHAYYGGLLEHIVTLMHTATSLIHIYPELNKDLVITTCLLHDIGKTKELSDPIVPQYTTEGELIGHLVLGVEMINEAALSNGIASDDRELLALKHCILSHHGEIELGYGSAVSGKLPEAVFFHYLDQIDAKLNGMQMTKQQSEEEWIYSPMLKRKILNKKW